jgi:type II secretory ATPase GspE/PulE/Tfp pilus assembly ATPase PilB-like protein
MKIGQILVNAGLIDEKQLEIALAEQAKTGAKLGLILADLGFTTEDAVSRALAQQSGVAHIDADDADVEPAAAALVPEATARRLCALPLRIEGKTLLVAMSNPTDIIAIDELQRSAELFVRVVSTGHRQLLRALDRAYGGASEMGSALEQAIQRATEEAAGEAAADSRGAVIPLVDELLTMAIRRGATDVHLQPDKRVVRARLRIDGELSSGATLPVNLLAPIVARIKVLTGLDLSESRLPQDGKLRFPFDKGAIDMRVSTFPSVNGESVVIRILDKNRQKLSLDALGVDPHSQGVLRRMAQRPNGLILAAGPTGSGKSTTLFALLRTIDASRRKVITLEDPVEYELPLVTQCQVNEKAGLGFATGLRSILRHDPDVVLVGEMRDPETASLALRAAMTGHLVFSTVHTNGAIATVGRLLDMGLDRYLIASCLVGVAAQRLVRRMCPHCATGFSPEAEDLAVVGISAEAGGKFRRGEGCERCDETGYAGREALFELLELTPTLSRLISRGAHADELEAAAREAEFVPFRERAQRSAREGRITLDEVARITTDF